MSRYNYVAEMFKISIGVCDKQSGSFWTTAKKNGKYMREGIVVSYFVKR